MTHLRHICRPPESERVAPPYTSSTIIITCQVPRLYDLPLPSAFFLLGQLSILRLAQLLFCWDGTDTPPT